MGLGVRRFFRWPRRTVRLRLTILYAGLFLVCGVALLTITYLVEQSTSFGFQSEGGASGSSVAGTPACPGPSGGETGPGCPDFTSQVHAAEAAQLPLVAAISLGGAALLSGGLGWIVAGRTLRPLRNMTATTREISAENLHRRLGMDGPDDELKDLGDTIDGLLERLERAFEAQRTFVANASHELRTPLAMMRTSLDVAMAKTEPISPQLRALAPKLQDGLDRAEALLEGLLVLARAQHGVRPDVSDVSLAELASAALQARAEDVAALRLRVLDQTADVRVWGNRVLLGRLVANLIENAIRYNRPGGWVRVNIAAIEGHAFLAVENSGPSLDPARVEELVQPFLRLGADRLDGSGFGLGLSIVAAVASAHEGALELRARAEGGLLVVVSFPMGGAGSAAGRLS